MEEADAGRAGAGFEHAAGEGFGIAQWQQRGDSDAGADAGGGQLGGRIEALVDARALGLEALAHLVVVRGDAEVDADMGEAAEEVDVAGDDRAAGLDDEASAALGEDGQQGAGEPEAALDRLVGVGGAAHQDGAAAEVGAHAAQALDGVGLDADPAAPGFAVVLVGDEEGGVAVGAGESAALVGVERVVEHLEAAGGAGEDGGGVGVADFGGAELAWADRFGVGVDQGELHGAE